jgi:hypothetical protein
MADLGTVGISQYGGTYVNITSTDNARCTVMHPNPTPAPQGGVIVVSTTGGTRS